MPASASADTTAAAIHSIILLSSPVLVSLAAGLSAGAGAGAGAATVYETVGLLNACAAYSVPAESTGLITALLFVNRPSYPFAPYWSYLP